MIYIYPKKLISKINMSIRIILEDEKGETKVIRVNEDDLIKTCKEKSGYSPAFEWTWISDGCALKDDKTIKDYNLKEDDIIICSKVIKGG